MTSLAELANNFSGGPISLESIALKKSAVNKRILRVLLAEDSRMDQEITGRMLRMLGHDVDTVENGAEAVLAAGRIAYDLLINGCSDA
jgi:PleD family two-component response regulator